MLVDYSREKYRALTLYRNQSVVSIPSCYFLPRYNSSPCSQKQNDESHVNHVKYYIMDKTDKKVSKTRNLPLNLLVFLPTVISAGGLSLSMRLNFQYESWWPLMIDFDNRPNVSACICFVCLFVCLYFCQILKFNFQFVLLPWYNFQLRGYCTSGPYFWKLCAFSQKINQIWTKYRMDLVRNIPRNSKITVSLQ